MEKFTINKSTFIIVKRQWPYAILKSEKPVSQLVYKIEGCTQYEKQFNTPKQ